MHPLSPYEIDAIRNKDYNMELYHAVQRVNELLILGFTIGQKETSECVRIQRYDLGVDRLTRMGVMELFMKSGWKIEPVKTDEYEYYLFSRHKDIQNYEE